MQRLKRAKYSCSRGRARNCSEYGWIAQYLYLRRREDSNLWRTYILGGFQNRCLRPLSHSSRSTFYAWLFDRHTPSVAAIRGYGYHRAGLLPE